MEYYIIIFTILVALIPFAWWLWYFFRTIFPTAEQKKKLKEIGEQETKKIHEEQEKSEKEVKLARLKKIEDYKKRGGKTYIWEGYDIWGSIIGNLFGVIVLIYLMYSLYIDNFSWYIVFLFIPVAPLWLTSDYEEGEEITAIEMKFLKIFNTFLKLLKVIFFLFILGLLLLWISNIQISATTIIIILLLIIIYNQYKK